VHKRIDALQNCLRQAMRRHQGVIALSQKSKQLAVTAFASSPQTAMIRCVIPKSCLALHGGSTDWLSTVYLNDNGNWSLAAMGSPCLFEVGFEPAGIMNAKRVNHVKAMLAVHCFRRGGRTASGWKTA
jgi:RNase P/RNase MRP subunit POP5